VHHLDGDGHNNNIENLQLTTKKGHFSNHFDAVKEVASLKAENERLKQEIATLHTQLDNKQQSPII